MRAVFKEAGQGDRVFRHLGVGAQARGNPLPVRPGADEKADDDPQLAHAGHKQGAGKAHEQPA